MKPKELIEKWVEIFNTGDTEKIAALYHDDATNQHVANGPVKGREAIREIFAW
jgi:ketosteroid isomerase-like protein